MALNNRNVFLIALEADSLIPGCQHGWFLRDALLWACRWSPSCLCSSSILWDQRKRELPHLFFKDTNPTRSSTHPLGPHLTLITSCIGPNTVTGGAAGFHVGILKHTDWTVKGHGEIVYSSFLLCCLEYEIIRLKAFPKEKCCPNVKGSLTIHLIGGRNRVVKKP